MGLLMGLMFDVNHRVVVVLILQLAYFLFCAIRNSFKDKYVQARKLLNEATIVVIIVLAAVLEYAPEVYQPGWLWGVIGLVIICLVFSIACLVMEMCNQCCRKEQQVYPDNRLVTLENIAPQGE